MIDRQPCVYILASAPFGTLYIGVTSNLHEHRSDVSKGFTSRYQVHRLMRFELFDTMEGAIEREKQLKRWHRQWKINLIETDNPHWVDLAASMGFAPVPPRGRRNGP